jgi:NTE family protein
MTTRALVLSGGGPVGIAWECGLIGGLAEAGVDLSSADFILGTSAGSFVGAQLAMGVTPRALAAPFLAMGEDAQLPRPASAASRPAGPPPDLTQLMRLMAEAASGARPAEEARAAIGAFALSAPTMDEDAFLYSFGRFLNELAPDAWPERGYACTAVDALDGSFHVWTRDSGVGLGRAVASSCAVPGVYPPVTIKGRRYIDGGMRSATNADIAKGHDVVVVVAIRAGAATSPAAERARMRLEGELAALRGAGARVEVIAPDEASLQALGVNLMDARRRPGAAAAGYAQGRAGADAQALLAAWAG